MSKIVSVDPTGWILDSTLEDYYRSVLPLGDTLRPDSELQALMETAPGRGPRAMSMTTRRPTPKDQIVIDALGELEERDRIILELVHGAHMSLRQIEGLTGIPKTTVARRRDLAPQLLAEILKRLMPELADKYYLD
jgi:DNA-directed RNA polymerase specialized sigma24 family protein|tara:strand:+ start:4490 stop:4897 length:408 start_codon:yes stop_codon:yes gene_type:complete